MSLLGSQAIQSNLRLSQQGKEASAGRIVGTPLGSIQELLDLQLEGKLSSRWDGPFVITNVSPHSAVELKDNSTNNTFQVNGHQLKIFDGGPLPTVGVISSYLVILMHIK
ncbi:hypothetical protein CR513_08277, partial [Mucuna pruriens]